ncbi:MAG TPA: 4-hydroxy-tetrahydrodipicolinate synthase, partial [Rhizomicrobium sp.]|nr:4-hydroxy-tetrahydrodipicolinate synthase [Rhizomicrobium sp.]
GSIPALITPMKDGKVDEAAFRKLVNWQIAEGSSGLVPCGTTGESPTLSHDEHMRVIEICVEEAAGRVPVIAGTGSNATDEAIALTRHAKEVGCDAVLSVTGYYNKPSQEGQYRHFMAVADAVDIPILLYNIPGRAIVEITVETMARLAKHKNIIGVKDATANLMRPSRERLTCGKDWLLISGEDGTALGYNAHGGKGCISVTANVAPKLCAEFQAATLAGDFAKAREYQDKLMPLHDAMFCEPSPAPAKYGVSLLGHCTPDVRLPLVEATEGARAQVKSAMQKAGLKV